jgi:Asp-tRNA(Asn)/Glu-tRNA(Gln) amidotransferase A subunit family amidase
MAPLCTGSDTGGSLRVPSTFCGIAAIRPSVGVVPYERRAFAYSPFQVIGPMARDVGDLALMFGVMAQHDPMEAMSQALSAQSMPAVDLSGLRVAFSADLGFAPTSRMIRRVFTDRVARLAPLFGRAEEAHPPMAGAVEANWVLRALQVLHQHRERYERHRDKLGPLVVENVEAAMKITVEQVGQAMAEQNRLHQVFAAFFLEYDVLICPGATRGPFPVEELAPREIDGEVQETFVRWAGLTNGLSVTANPVVALPLGLDEDGLPFGVQIVGPRNADWRLLAVAAAIETAGAADAALSRPRPDLARLRAA